MSSAIYWNWHVMFPDPTHRYGSSLTAVRVRTRNDRSSMATAVSRPTRGIKNVYEIALMTMLGREQLVLDSPWVVLGRRKKKKNLFPVGKYNIDTHNACRDVPIVNVNYYVVTDLLELICHVCRWNAQVRFITDWRSNPEPSFVDDSSYRYWWHQKRLSSRTDDHAGQRAIPGPVYADIGPNWGKQTAASQLSSKCWLGNSP